jgi:hypothetical protein
MTTMREVFAKMRAIQREDCFMYTDDEICEALRKALDPRVLDAGEWERRIVEIAAHRIRERSEQAKADE